jgi:hypothetical protein
VSQTDLLAARKAHLSRKLAYAAANLLTGKDIFTTRGSEYALKEKGLRQSFSIF